MKRIIILFLSVVLVAVLTSCRFTIVPYQNYPDANNSTLSSKVETEDQELSQTEATDSRNDQLEMNEEDVTIDETALPEDYAIPDFLMITVPGANYSNDLEFNDTYGSIVEEFITESYELCRTEVTYELWFSVKVWAKAHGYTFQNEGCEGSNGKVGAKPTEAMLEPVTCVSWNDCIVWLNALSEMTGKTPVYINSNRAILRSAKEVESKTLSGYNIIVAKTDGYRLPSCDEWEAAARYIDGVTWTYQFNASGSSETTDNVKATEEVAVFNANKTANVATKKPNALGIYDMSGNVFEWCYDYFYEISEGSDSCYMFMRGGSWCTHQPYDYDSLSAGIVGSGSILADEVRSYLGFRIARSLPLINEHVDMPDFTMRSVPAGSYKIPTEDNISYYKSGFKTDDPKIFYIYAEGGFEIGITEVTYELWYAVRVWAEEQGYRFQNPGMEGSGGIIGAPPTEARLEPVTYISCLDVMVWLNALSELKGKAPVYLTQSGETLMDGTNGQAYLSDIVQSDRRGYRLPIVPEWLLAARYIDGEIWVPGDYASGITPDMNYDDCLSEFAIHNSNETAKVATKKPNALGIYDMSGNVSELCLSDLSLGSVSLGGSYDFIDAVCGQEFFNYVDLSADDTGTLISTSQGFRFILK
jgi:formylglycine-generating enzyme required for sulfatase activity